MGLSTNYAQEYATIYLKICSYGSLNVNVLVFVGVSESVLILALLSLNNLITLSAAFWISSC
jgi:hypothetical protein